MSLRCAPLTLSDTGPIATNCNLLLSALSACGQRELVPAATDGNICLTFFSERPPECVEAFGNYVACVDVKGCAFVTTGPCGQSYDATTAICGNFLNVILSPRMPRGYY